eukprot:265415-Prymnesium_polylepis.2
MGLVRVLTRKFMLDDISMYDEEADEPALVRSMELIDELGQVSHIFSDKTGTLTSNHMCVAAWSSTLPRLRRWEEPCPRRLRALLTLPLALPPPSGLLPPLTRSSSGRDRPRPQGLPPLHRRWQGLRSRRDRHIQGGAGRERGAHTARGAAPGLVRVPAGRQGLRVLPGGRGRAVDVRSPAAAGARGRDAARVSPCARGQPLGAAREGRWAPRAGGEQSRRAGVRGGRRAAGL